MSEKKNKIFNFFMVKINNFLKTFMCKNIKQFRDLRVFWDSVSFRKFGDEDWQDEVPTFAVGWPN